MNIFFWRKKKQNKFLIYAPIILFLLAAAVFIFLYRDQPGPSGEYVPVADQAGDRIKPAIQASIDDTKQEMAENKVENKVMAKNEEELEQKLQAAMNLCPSRNQQMINGVFENIDGEYVYIKQPLTGTESETIRKIKLLPETVYIRTESGSGDNLAQEEITFNDLAVGESALAIAAEDEDSGELSALIIKRIDFKE